MQFETSCRCPDRMRSAVSQSVTYYDYDADGTLRLVISAMTWR